MHRTGLEYPRSRRAPRYDMTSFSLTHTHTHTHFQLCLRISAGIPLLLHVALPAADCHHLVGRTILQGQKEGSLNILHRPTSHPMRNERVGVSAVKGATCRKIRETSPVSRNQTHSVNPSCTPHDSTAGRFRGPSGCLLRNAIISHGVRNYLGLFFSFASRLHRDGGECLAGRPRPPWLMPANESNRGDPPPSNQRPLEQTIGP